MANWQKKAAKLAAGAGGGSAARIADLAQQAAGKPMSRREFLQKVGALAGSAALKKVPVPDAMPAAPSIAPVAETFAPGSFLPEAFWPGFAMETRTDDGSTMRIGAIHGYRAPGKPGLAVLDNEDWILPWDSMEDDPRDEWLPSKEEMVRLTSAMRDAQRALASAPEGVPVTYNHLTRQWHVRVPTAVHEHTIPAHRFRSGRTGEIRIEPASTSYYGAEEKWLRGNQPLPSWATASNPAPSSLAHQIQHWNKMTGPGDIGWDLPYTDPSYGGVEGVMKDWQDLKSHAARRLLDESRDSTLDPDQQRRLRQHLLDLDRPAGGRANDPPPPAAMRRHHLGMESMGLPGDEERDAFGRVKRVLGVALPLGAAAGSQQEQPRLLDGLRN